jgi:hypothetical protein
LKKQSASWAGLARRDLALVRAQRDRPLLVVVEREVESPWLLDRALLETLGQALEDLGNLGSRHGSEM